MVTASNGKISWSSIGRTLGVNKERARSLWRRYNSAQPVLDHITYNGITTKVEEYHKILKILRTERTLDELCRILKMKEKNVLGLLEEIKGSGYKVVQDIIRGNLCFLYIPKPEAMENEAVEAYVGDTITVGLVSDTHMGSNFFNKGALDKFYRYAHSLGVNKFYHVGDITDGFYKSRDTSWFEQYAHGFSQQLADVVNNYPRIEGCTTTFISGNHDLTHLYNGGANIGEEISRQRDDMIYEGHNFAKVWLTDKIDMNLVHPTDGGAWAVTHKIQKIIDSAQGIRKSKILLVGHYHKMAWIDWKGTQGIVMPSFQEQTPFMRDNNLASYVGGIILTIKTDRDGNMLSFSPTYVSLGADI